MNAAPGQGQGQGQAGQAGHPNPAGVQNNVQNMMYRPEMMRSIRFLTEDERGKYEKGLSLLWKQHDAAALGSAENIEAKRKISDFGRMLVGKIQQRRAAQLQQSQQQAQQAQLQQAQALQAIQAQQAQQGQQGQHPQPPQSEHPGQGAQSIQQPPSNAQQAAAGSSNDGANGPPPTPTTASMQPSGAAAAGATAASAAAAVAAQHQQFWKGIPPNIQNHVNEMVFQPPANAPDKEKWIQEFKLKYARALFQMEQTRAGVQKIDLMAKERKEKGQPLTAEEEKAFADKKAQFSKQHTEAYSFVSTIRKQYTSAGNGVAKTAQAGGVPQGGNQVRPQGPVRQAPVQPGAAPGGAVAMGAGGPMQHSTAAVNAAIEAAKNQQLQAGRLGNANSLPGQQQGPQAHPGQAPAAPAQPQPSPVTQAPPSQATTAQQHPQQQAPIKTEPGAQQGPHIPAPLNTAITAGVGSGMQGTGTPTQNSARVQTPQSATPTNAAIRPLTHAAAINLASQQRAGSIGGQPGSTPSSAPGSIGGPQQQGHPHAHPTVTQPAGQSLQTKMPIAKNLPEKATQIPTPVAAMGGVGSGRPTFSGGSGIAGGVMNQPALAKTPAYQLEGEGERVLNKKKLDELVRQICGGTAEGQEGNPLTPDVEESILNLADHFVDNVLHSACRNAKERGSKILEIRDIQLVLERTYNIRIPGYSSEELRTVRKVQPNAQWITKMSAVQAAKVMPGKGDL